MLGIDWGIQQRVSLGEWWDFAVGGKKTPRLDGPLGFCLRAYSAGGCRALSFLWLFKSMVLGARGNRASLTNGRAGTRAKIRHENAFIGIYLGSKGEIFVRAAIDPAGKNQMPPTPGKHPMFLTGRRVPLFGNASAVGASLIAARRQ
jgi:hypothetical protein